MIRWNLPMSVYLITVFPPLPAIAPDFSQNLVKTQTLARQGGDVLIECKPRMSPRGVISWRKGKEALRESYRYVCVRPPVCLLCLRRGVASTRYFMFAHSISSVTELQSTGPTVLTRYNLNCITRCALLRPPSRTLHFSLSSETLLYSAVPGCAQRRFLHCLLNVIGHSRTAAGLDRCADPSAH